MDNALETFRAQLAYNAYRKQSGGVSLISGAPLPTWFDLPESVQDAWRAVALAVSIDVLLRGRLRAA